MDLSQATGAPEEVELLGDAYPVRLLNFREWGLVTAWLKKVNPSPLTRALLAIQQAKDSGEEIGQAAQDELLDHAQRAALSWPPQVGSVQWLDAIERVDGGLARLLFEVLSKTNEDFTIEKATLMAPKIPSHEWSELIRVSLHGVHPSPKAVAANGDMKN